MINKLSMQSKRDLVMLFTELLDGCPKFSAELSPCEPRKAFWEAGMLYLQEFTKCLCLWKR